MPTAFKIGIGSYERIYMDKSTKQAKLSLIVSMLIFGTIGVFRKYIDLPSGIIAMSRGLIGAASLVLFIVLKKQRISWAAVKHNLVYLILSGAMLGLNWVLLFEAYRYTTVATATLCYYMAPIVVILLSPLTFREKLNIKKLLCVATAFIGMIFVSGIFETGFGGFTEKRGVLLGLAAATMYAGLVIINKKVSDISAFDKTAIQLGVAGLALVPYSLLTTDAAEVSFTPFIVVLLIIVGVLHTGVAHVLYFGSMKTLKAQTVALFSYIDPVVAVVLSALLLHESPGVSGVIGAVLILGSTFVSELTE